MRGTKLVFGLTMPGLRVDDPVQSMVWLGTTESVQFGVSIPKRYPPEQCGRHHYHLPGLDTDRTHSSSSWK